ILVAMTVFIPALSILVVVPPTYVLAQTSSDYFVMGKQSWAELECAALADWAREDDEYKRLLTQGIAKQRTFIEARNAGKVDQKDVFNEMPSSYFRPWMSVPSAVDVSADFEIGVLWAAAKAEAQSLIDKNDPDGRTEVQVEVAKNALSNKNCS